MLGNDLVFPNGRMNPQRVPFRVQYQILPDRPRALSDEEIAEVMHFSSRSGGGHGIAIDKGEGSEALKALLPTPLHGHYDSLREDKRFNKFVLFAKGPEDGMLVGFGEDELYYVIAVWDGHQHETWTPHPGIIHPDGKMDPLVKWA